MPSPLTRRGAVLPYELKTMVIDGNRVQHAVIVCCNCPDHTANFPWVHGQNPKSICEKFERMGWEVYKNKARCPDCKKARKRQQHHFATLDRQKLREEKMRTTTTQNGSHPANQQPTNHPVTAAPPVRPTYSPTAVHPSQPVHAPQPVHVPPPPPKEVVKIYLLTVHSDGTVDTRDIDGAKEMLFGDQTYLVIPR